MAAGNLPATDLEVAMYRALFVPLTMLLLIATAIAMLASAIILPMPHALEFSAPGETDVVERFYAAINDAIATGSTAALRRVVGLSFADETPLPGVNLGRDGLETYLATLHDADPGLRLEPQVIFANSQEVVARVAVWPGPAEATQPATFGGQQTVWSPVEVLRIADGVVVGRWGHTDGLAFAQPLASQTLDLPGSNPYLIGLARVTQAPGTRWDAERAAGPRLLFLQQGALEVQAVPGPATSVVPGAATTIVASDAGRVRPPLRATLAAGQTWQAPAGALTSTTNAGSAEAQFLEVTFAELLDPRVAALSARSLPAGVAVQVLAGDLTTGRERGPVRVALERIALTPQASLTLSSAEGPLLAAVETGQLEAATWGAAWVRRSRDGVRASAKAATLTPENGLLLQSGGVVTLRNTERTPAQALVLTVRGLRADGGSDP